MLASALRLELSQKVRIPTMNSLECRFCAAALTETFVDLGMSPLANSYVEPSDLNRGEKFYPLHTYVCTCCWLVQLPEVESREKIFGDYSYFSSYSESWLRHAKGYSEEMIRRFGFDRDSQVVEVASNDGYLLRYFKQRQIPVLGIEPAANVAAVAEADGIPTRVKFFGVELARQLRSEGVRADLLVGNNVLAHTPYLNDFVAGLAELLAPAGVVTLEFPHLLRLVAGNQFDTIYHEHYSYFSFTTVRRVLEQHGLEVFDVEELSTHGGSLRIYSRHPGGRSEAISERVEELAARELAAGYATLEPYRAFAQQVRETKRNLLEFLIKTQHDGKRLAAYGAPAKGNTLLNYCGLRGDFVDYTVDRSPHKQGRYLPGTRIPVYAPDRLLETRPDYVWILPWNLRQEIVEQMAAIRDWGGRFVVAIPEVEVL